MSKSTAVARIVPAAVAPHVESYEPTFQDLLAMGNELVKTGFLPESIKNGAQAAAIIMAGRELGLPAMRSLRSIVLVKGKVTEYADSQLSRFKSDGGHAVFTELSDTRAVLKLSHPNGDTHTETFTLDDAKKAGLLSSPMYSKFPKAMLRSRAITAAIKSIGWEGGAGVYDPAELAETPVTAQTERQEQAQDTNADDTGDTPSAKQRELLAKLLKSHVFSDEERAKVSRGVKTRARMTSAIDWALKEIEARNAAEVEVTTDDDATDVSELVEEVA